MKAWPGISIKSHFIEDFYTRKRSKDLPLVLNDTATILRGPYATRAGAVVAVDISEEIPKFLIEFGDGTDELIPLNDLEKNADAA